MIGEYNWNWPVSKYGDNALGSKIWTEVSNEGHLSGFIWARLLPGVSDWLKSLVKVSKRFYGMFRIHGTIFTSTQNMQCLLIFDGTFLACGPYKHSSQS